MAKSRNARLRGCVGMYMRHKATGTCNFRNLHNYGETSLERPLAEDAIRPLMTDGLL